MDQNEQQIFHDFCLNILAHSEADMEVTIDGNGVNSSEAYWVVKALMKRLKVEITDDEVSSAATKLEAEYI